MFEIKVMVGSAADAQQAATLFQRLADDMSGNTRNALTQSTILASQESVGTVKNDTAETADGASGAVDDVAGRSLADSNVPATGTPAPRGRGRPKKPADPVAAYVEAGGTMPPDPAPADQPDQPAQVEPAHAEEPDTAGDTRTRDDLIAEMRKVGTAKGALWFRDMLTKEKAGKLSDLTDDALRRSLAAAAA